MDMMMFCNQNGCTAMRREFDALRMSVVALDTKFHECFGEVDSFEEDALQCDVAELRKQVIHNGKVASRNYDAIRGELDEVFDTLRQIQDVAASDLVTTGVEEETGDAG